VNKLLHFKFDMKGKMNNGHENPCTIFLFDRKLVKFRATVPLLIWIDGGDASISTGSHQGAEGEISSYDTSGKIAITRWCHEIISSQNVSYSHSSWKTSSLLPTS